jgi:single-stranded-DNA-specific exonuclease
MTLGIQCLLCEQNRSALALAEQLDALNIERRAIETTMKEKALLLADHYMSQHALSEDRYTLSLYDEAFHQGVVGIVASRVKDLNYKPCFIFARHDNSQTLRGSGRSIPGFHLRDALDLVSKRHPDLILAFGGHAMAAGLTLRADGLTLFDQAFEKVGRELLSDEIRTRTVWVESPLPASHLHLQTAETIHNIVWGQAFPEPLFLDHFEVTRSAIMGKKHLKCWLRKDSTVVEGLIFNRTEPLPSMITAAYRMIKNEWQGGTTLQLYLEHVEPYLTADQTAT